MPGWRRILVVAGALLALLPSAAAAQSAGDEQYSDPFGGTDQTQAQATPAPVAPTTPAPAAQPAQAPTTPAPSAPAQPAPAGAHSPLPRTGADARLPALLGLALLSAGVALRARARRDT
jgi:LPXTG-motif cell wall-anchored protein